MSIEDRLRQIVTALPDEASVTLPVVVVKEWLEVEADDPRDDLTVADVALQLRRSPGTVREWIRGESWRRISWAKSIASRARH